MTALLCCRRSALSRYAHVADGSYPQPDWLIDRVAQYAAGDQRRREVPEYGGENPRRIGEVRVDGESFSRQPGHTGRPQDAAARSRS